MNTTTQKTEVANAVEFILGSVQAETIAQAAETLCDISKDAQVSKDQIAGVFREIRATAGEVSYSAWEAVRTAFESVAVVRSRDNGAIDPEGAANDRWSEVTKYLREIHGMKKPSKSGEDPKSAAARMEAKRATERAEAAKLAEGKSAADLKAAQVALYQTATPEAIAKAKSLDKAIKLVEKVEKQEVSGRIDPLKKAAQAEFKATLDALVEAKNERALADLVILLKRFPADCAKRDAGADKFPTM